MEELKIYDACLKCNYKNEKLTPILNFLYTMVKNHDYFLRGVNEIPEDYEFDYNAEYEGWLQYRWGNGKNAVDYVEPKKNLTPKESSKLEMYEGREEDYELDEDYEYEAIENTFDDLLDKEMKNKLIEKYGW